MYFIIHPFSLGFILIAQNKQGVCAIFLGNSPNKLSEKIESLQPYAQRMTTLDEVSKKVIHFIENPGLEICFSLDIQGTIFQKNVWRILQNIPSGSTSSYQDIACELGHPRAYRAVARACAMNKLAVVIPCHRVIKSDGALSGYRWGTNIKKGLLEIEFSKIGKVCNYSAR